MSKIEWTNTTWNPLVGCSKKSAGCKNCYAIRMAMRLATMPHSRVAYDGIAEKGNWTGVVRLIEDRIDQPLKWRKPRMVFVNSMSDLFHPDVPFEWVNRIFAVMALAHKHTFQILTKRPDRMAEYFDEEEDRWMEIGTDIGAYCPRGGWIGKRADKLVEQSHGVKENELGEYSDVGQEGWPLPNVWIGTSVENQKTADERIPHLLQSPAAIRFLSCEPLLGTVNLQQWMPCPHGQVTSCPHDDLICCQCVNWNGDAPSLDWVICGGESGPGARLMDPEWARSLRDQCISSRVSFFMKQMTKKKPVPEDLLVREFPNAEA